MRSREIWLLAALTVLAVVVRLPHIGQSMWVDEMFSVHCASHPLPGFFQNVAKDVHPPLYYLLLHFWLKLGRSDVWVRTLSLAAGLGVVWWAYAIGRVIGGVEWAVASGALAAFSPGLVWPSQEARNYILMTFWAGAALFFLFRGLRDLPRWGSWLLFGLCEGLALLSFYYAVFFVIGVNAALAAYCLQSKIRTPLAARVIVSALLALAVFGLWAPHFIVQASMAEAANKFVPLATAVRRVAWEASAVDPFSTIGWTLQTLHFPWPSIATCMVFGSLVLLAAVRMRRADGPASKDGVYILVLTLAIAATVIGAPMLGWLKGLFVGGRYFVFLDLVGVLLFVSLVGVLVPSVRWRALVYTAACAAQLAWLPSQGYYKKEPWREAAQFVDAHVRPGDCLIGLAGETGAYAYYGRSKVPRYNLPEAVRGAGRRVPSIDWVNALREEDLPAVAELLRKYKRVIAIWSHTSFTGKDRGERLLHKWFKAHGYQVVARAAFVGGRGVRVEIFQRPDHARDISGSARPPAR